MCSSRLIRQVDVNKIYQHTLAVEGIRHPIDHPEKLDQAANYILSEFEHYGLEAKEQPFKIEGIDTTFRNIEGVTNEGGGSELLIVSHYDTVYNSPGANDNGSGIAVMLESARVLAQEDEIPSIRFISFSLEEFSFIYTQKAKQIAKKLGLMDENDRYTTAHTHQMMKKVAELQSRSFSEGKSLAEIFTDIRSEFQNQLTSSESAYLRKLQKMYQGITLASYPGTAFAFGSNFWVEEAARTNKEVSGMLCLETVGYTSEKEHSQMLPEGMNLDMFQTYNVPDITVGNFIAAIGDVNSTNLVQAFCNQSRHRSIQLPYACLLVPLHYEKIVQLGLFDLLRSDHAPFWRKRIPAVLLTDTANFRYPFYHTQADTCDKLDFNFMAKLCKTIVATTIDLAKSEK